MPVPFWLRPLKAALTLTPTTRRAGRRVPAHRCRLEALEDRCVPATISRFTEYTSDSTQLSFSAADSIVAGPPGDNHIWFTENGVNMIGRIDTTSHQIDEFPATGSNPSHIAADSACHIWYSVTLPNGNTKITEINANNGQTLFNYCTANVSSFAPSPGGDFVWFAAAGATEIARLKVSDGFLDHFPSPAILGPIAGSFSGYGVVPLQVENVAVDPGGNIWCTGHYQSSFFDPITYGAAIGSLSASGDQNQFGASLDADTLPSELAFHTGGGTWASISGGGIRDIYPALVHIPRVVGGGYEIYPSFAVVPFDIPTPGSNPSAIAAADGNAWFAESGTAKIGRFTPAGSITEFAMPPNTGVSSLAVGSDGNLWFVDPRTKKIGEFNVTINQAPAPNMVIHDSSSTRTVQPSPIPNSPGNFTATVTEGNIVLDASGPQDPDLEDNQNLTYSWVMPDGSARTGRGASWSFSDNPSDPGTTYPLSLTVTDPFGLSATIHVTLTVVNAPPVVTATLLPNPGSFDGTFGTNGVAVTDATTTGDSVSNPVSLPDGRIMMLFSGSDGIGFRRFLANGSPDTTFGTAGRMVIISNNNNNNNLPFSAIQAVAVQGDKIIVAGPADDGNTVLARYTADGILDTDFGFVTTGIAASAIYVEYPSPTSTDNGKILVAGNTPYGAIALRRFNLNGAADCDFNPATPVPAWVQTLAVQSDGKILVGGVSGYGFSFTVARYNHDGVLDVGFGDYVSGTTGPQTGWNNDVTFFPNNDVPSFPPLVLSALAFDPRDNGIVAVGNGGLVRYTADGKLDTGDGTPVHPGFGEDNGSGQRTGVLDGQVSVAIVGGQFVFPNSTSGQLGFGWYSQPSGMAIQSSDGKILVGGTYGAFLARLNADGSFDTSFGPNLNGQVYSTSGAYTPTMLFAGGRVTLIGSLDHFDVNGQLTDHSVALVRYTTAPPPDHIVAGQTFTLAFSATDPSPDDQAAGFTYQIDWGNGTSDQPPSQTVTHFYAAVTTETTYTISVYATDKDGIAANGQGVKSFPVTVEPVTTSGLQAVLNGALPTYLVPTDPVTNLPAIVLPVNSLSDFNAVINEIAGLSRQSTPVAVVLNAAGVDLTDFRPSIPQGLTLVVNGAVYHGGSPALTLVSGNLVITGSTFLNTTNAPTILVTGGHLTLRHDIIQESTGYNRPAIQITDGSVDLGTASDPGGNTININGAGELIHNTGANSVSAIGNTFQVNGTALTSTFRIEDKVYHALDAAGAGLVTYVAGNVYVTNSSGSVQRGVDAVAAGGTVNVEAGSYSAYVVGAKLLTVSFQGGPSVALQPDPLAPGQTDVVVTGTAGNDDIKFTSGPGDSVVADVGNWPKGRFSPTGRIVAYGLAGDDDIQVGGGIQLAAWLYGGEGNDRLKSGKGGDVLLGGAGDDLLVSGGDRDLLIGGTGSDRLTGSAGDDLLIAGSTAFDGNDAALLAIVQEWSRADRTYQQRYADLMTAGVGDGGAVKLNATTVFDDGVQDVLTGGSGQDWFFVNLFGGGVYDKITDLTAKEFATDLSFILGP